MKNENDNQTFFDKVKSVGTAASKKVLYPAFLLHSVLKNEKTPFVDKVLIVSAIAYFFLFTDLIPDFIPVLGYADDLTALLAVVKAVSRSITPDVEGEAKNDFEHIFGESSDTTL